jgi:hypothetical protein
MNFIINETQYKRILKEQPESRFSFGYNPWSKDPNQSASAAMKRQSEFVSDMSNFIYDNRHGLLDIASVGAAFIPIVGPFISIGLELGNAALYVSEGDNYSGGLALAFALIPGGQLVRRIPAVKKLGRNGLSTLLKKAKNPKLVKTLTKTEKEALEQINKNSKWVTLTAAKELSKKIANTAVKKMSLPQLVKFVYSFSKKYPKIYNITTMGLQIGGIWYSYDKLAQIYGIKNKSEGNVNKSKNQNSGPYTTEGDPYQYRVVNGVWETKGNNIKNWVSLKDRPEAIKELDKRFPKARIVNSDKLITKKQLETEFNKDKGKLNNELVNTLTNGLTDEQKHEAFQKRMGEEIKF